LVVDTTGGPCVWRVCTIVMVMLLRRVVGVLRLLRLMKRLLHHRSQGIQYIGVRKHGESTVNCRRGQKESASELKM
jgi:hypothetical protein